MDTDYQQCGPDFDPALTTVLSKTEGERIVVDAGLKSLSCEHGIPAVKDLPGVATRRLTAEHGIIDMPYSYAPVNLHEQVYGVRNALVEKGFGVAG